MRQWTHQHNVPTRRHKVVMPSLFMLCEGSKPNPGDLLLCEGSKSNPGDLLLCDGSKSNPGHTLFDLSTNRHFLSFFQPIIDLFLIQFVLRFPIISLFNQETGWVSGLYYFHHIISSLNQVLDSCYDFPPFFVV